MIAAALVSLVLLAVVGAGAYLWWSPASVRVLDYDVEGPNLAPTRHHTAGQPYRYRVVIGLFTIYKDR